MLMHVYIFPGYISKFKGQKHFIPHLPVQAKSPPDAVEDYIRPVTLTAGPAESFEFPAQDLDIVKYLRVLARAGH